MTLSVLLSDYVTPRDFAEHFGFSEREVRKQAREIGACHVQGKRMILLECDVQKLLEAMKPCPSNFSKGQIATTTGTIEAPLTGGDYGALRERLTKRSRKEKLRRSKTAFGSAASMGRVPE